MSDDIKPTQISYMETDDYLVEQIVQFTKTKIKKKTGLTQSSKKDEITNDYSKFVVYDKMTREYTIQDNFEYQGIQYIPSISKLFDEESSCLVFPSNVEPYTNTDALIHEIRGFMQEYMELDSIYEIMLPYFILYTWIHDEFPFSIYVHFVGSTGTGKSRAIDVLSALCYKGLRGSGSITTSSLFRIIDQFQGTLFLNEFEMITTDDGGNEKLMILKSGSENYSVFRTEGDKDKYVQKYHMKCPKVFGGEKEISDAGLESRTITIPMKQAERKIPLYLPAKFYEHSKSIRNKLLLWRLDNIGANSMDDMVFGVPELMMLDKRSQQVMTPLYRLAGDGEKKVISDYAKKIEEDTFQARRESLGGRIFNVMASFMMIQKELVLKDITDEYNQREKADYKPRKIAGIIRKELSLEIKEMGHEKARTVVDDKHRFEKLCNYYGYESTYIDPLQTHKSPALARELDLGLSDNINSGVEENFDIV